MVQLEKTLQQAEIKALALMLADLSVAKPQSRPFVSADDPFSESQFKTLKYQPEFADRFGSLENGRASLPGLVATITSATAVASRCMVHDGLAAEVLDRRQRC